MAYVESLVCSLEATVVMRFFHFMLGNLDLGV